MRARRELILAVLLVALLGTAWALEPRFVTLRAQGILAAHAWELAILAVPMLLIVISGGIDLSVGSMVALSAVTFGLLHERGWPLEACAFAALLAGVSQGAVNGFFVAKLRVHPLLVTLATMAAFRGLAEGVSLARPLSGYPETFQGLAQGLVPPLAFVALAAAAHLSLTRMQFGRRVIAIGTDETVSRFTRLAVDRTKFLLYLLSGAACGMAAVLTVARNNTAKADLATGVELDVITAVVLGGASIHGGRGTVLGLVLGLAVIHQTRQFVSWHWKQSDLNLIVIGGLLIVTVLLDTLSRGRKGVRIEQDA